MLDADHGPGQILILRAAATAARDIVGPKIRLMRSRWVQCTLKSVHAVVLKDSKYKCFNGWVHKKCQGLSFPVK